MFLFKSTKRRKGRKVSSNNAVEEEDSLITGITVQILVAFEINSGNYTNDLLKFWVVQQIFVLGPQVDIEVTGSKSNVTVTFETKENGEDGEPKNDTLKISDGKNDLSFFKLCCEGEEAGIAAH